MEGLPVNPVAFSNAVFEIEKPVLKNQGVYGNG
jgi:hypothetical protein